MKYIQLKDVEIENEALTKTTFSYRGHLLVMCQSFPEGATIDVMKKYVKLNSKLKTAENDSLLALEDAEHELLLGKLRQQKFSFFAQELIDFYDAIEKAADKEDIAVSAGA